MFITDYLKTIKAQKYRVWTVFNGLDDVKAVIEKKEPFVACVVCNANVPTLAHVLHHP